MSPGTAAQTHLTINCRTFSVARRDDGLSPIRGPQLKLPERHVNIVGPDTMLWNVFRATPRLQECDQIGDGVMDEKVEGTVDTTRPRGLRSKKVRALLAGGLVLGIGGAITLAAWNDSEFAQGTFTAGTFNMQGSTDGTTYADHATVGAPATLAFTLNPTLLAPGDVVPAPFAVRLAANTTNNAVVTIPTPTTTSGTVTNLTYTLLQTSTFSCAADTTGTVLVPAGTAVITVPDSPSPTFNLAMGTPTSTAGAPVFLCFKVTAGALIAQGQTGTVTWRFAAESQ
jgi:predicted ribosomally synthesized peptide with SipW-like signal peptide